MEKVYRYVEGELVELEERDPARLYRYTRVNGELAYVELTPAEEAARLAEEQLPPPPFSGFGRALATRANQSVPNTTATLIQFGTVIQRGVYWSTGAPAAFTVPDLQGGVYDVKVSCRFNEASPGAGGTSNAGDRALQIRLNSSPVVTLRQRASASGDTELTAAADLELVVGDIIRVGVAQNCGGALPVDVRLTFRRVDG